MVFCIGLAPVFITIVSGASFVRESDSGMPQFDRTQFTDTKNTFLALPPPLSGCGTVADLDGSTVQM